MDILDILKKYSVEIPEDQQDNFNKDFRGAYKSIAEHKKLKDDLALAQSKLTSTSEYEGKYNTLYRKYEADLAEKQKVIDSMIFDNKLSKALSDVEFINGRVRDSVLGEIKSKGFKINENGDIDGLGDFIKGLKENEPDIFKNPQKVDTWAGGSSDTQNNNNNNTDIFSKCY